MMMRSVINQEFPSTLIKYVDNNENNDVFDSDNEYYEFETPRKSSIDETCSHKYYTIPTKQYCYNTKTPINVIDADFGVFESTKRKRRNPLTGLFKKRHSNNWEENLVNDPKMSLRPEPEVVSKKSMNRNIISSNNHHYNKIEDYYDNDNEVNADEESQYINQRKITIKNNNDGTIHEYYNENTYKRSSGPIQQIPKTSSYTKNKQIPSLPKHKDSSKRLSFFSKKRFDNHRKRETDNNRGERYRNDFVNYEEDDYNTYKDRLQQRKNMEQYERYFVNGMEKPYSLKCRPKSESRYPHSHSRNFQPQKNNNDSQINNSIQKTGESLTRFVTSISKSFNFSINNSLLSAKSSSEIQNLIINCISNLPGGNIFSPFLILLSRLIPNKESDEGSLIGTFIVVLSSTSLLLFSILSYRLFRFLYAVLSYVYSIARFFGITF